MRERLLDEPMVRQAIQAALAAALSIGFGSLVSGQRWYWAAIAAFIVGVGVDSRSEALIKGVQRLAGTMAGIVAGVLLASGVSEETNLMLGLVLICVFFAFYASQAAYGAMIFCITLMVALLYGLLGMFRPELLVLRLEETAVGAAVGVLVTMVVLPIRERDVFCAAAREFLDALSHTIELSVGSDDPAARQAGGEMQGKAQALRNAIGALKRGWSPLVPMRYRRAVRAAMRCAYLAREMVHDGGVDDAERRRMLQEIAEARVRMIADQPFEAPARCGDADRLPDALCEALRRFCQRIAEI